MAYQISLGLRNAIALDLRDRFNGNARLSIYAGTAPATADADATGATLLCVMTGPAGVGIEFEPTVTDGVLAKLASQTVSGTNAASGTATWFRLETLDDTRGASTTALRIQGNIGVAIGDMVMVNNVLTAGAVKTIDGAGFTIPAA